MGLELAMQKTMALARSTRPMMMMRESGKADDVHNMSSLSCSDAQRVDSTPAPAPATLPQTASNMPLFALIGMLAMVAALALKFAYNRS